MEILLIEDSPDDTELIRSRLADTQWNVFSTTRAERAREFLKTKFPDVILLDLDLPNGKGISLVESIVQAAGEIPVIVLTSMDENDELATGSVKAGALGYASKNTLLRTRSILLAQIELAMEKQLAKATSAKTKEAIRAADSIQTKLSEVRRIAEKGKAEAINGIKQMQGEKQIDVLTVKEQREIDAIVRGKSEGSF